MSCKMTYISAGHHTICSSYKNNYIQEIHDFLLMLTVNGNRHFLYVVVSTVPSRVSYLLYALSFLALSKALSMVFSFSPLHLGQYHFPLGL